MKLNAFNGLQGGVAFDLFRLSKAKATVDLSPNTLRKYHTEGLPFYRKGKAVFVSRAELTEFLTSQVTK